MRVCLLSPLGIAAQQHRGVLAAASSDDVYWNPLVEQQCFVAAADIVKAQLRKPEAANSRLEALRYRARIAQFCEIGSATTREHQGAVGEPHERKVDGGTTRNAGQKATMFLAFRHEQLNQAVIDRDGSKPARCLGGFGGAAMRLGVFERPGDRQRLVLDR